MCPARTTAVASVLVVALAGSAGAQPPNQVIEGPPICADCTIVPQRILTLGAPTDSVRLSANTGVFRDSRGRYYVRGTDGYNIVVFDSAGNYLRAIGTPGSGPGSFGRVRGFTSGAADSLVVFHSRGMTVLTPDHGFGRSMAMPQGRVVAAVLSDGSVLIGRDPREVLAPALQRLAADGAQLRGFGGPPGLPERTCRGCMVRVAARAERNDRIWIGRQNDYVLQLTDTAGNTVASFQRRMAGFEPWFSEPEFEMAMDDVMAQPRLMAVQSESAGRIWTQVLLPDPAYDSAAVRARLQRDRATARGDMESRMLMAIRAAGEAATVNHVEVIDVAAGRLVVSSELPDAIGLMQPGLGYMVRQNPSGVNQIDIYRLTISPR